MSTNILKFKMDYVYLDDKWWERIKYVLDIARPANCVIAGGSLVRAYIGADENDFDIWPMEPDAYYDVEENIFNVPCKVEKISNQATHVTVEGNPPYKVQIIQKTYPSIENIFEHFDLSICKLATDGEYLYADPDAWTGLTVDGKFHICRNNGYDRTLERVKKYQNLGFTISDEELNKLKKMPKKKSPYNNGDEGGGAPAAPVPNWQIPNAAALDRLVEWERLNQEAIGRAMEWEDVENNRVIRNNLDMYIAPPLFVDVRPNAINIGN